MAEKPHNDPTKEPEFKRVLHNLLSTPDKPQSEARRARCCSRRGRCDCCSGTQTPRDSDEGARSREFVLSRRRRLFARSPARKLEPHLAIAFRIVAPVLAHL